MRLRLFLCLSMLFLFVPLSAAAVQEPADLRVDGTPAKDATDLIRRSAIIAAGNFDTHVQAYPTGRSVSAGRIVNYIQTFHVKKTMKGPALQRIRVLSTGIDPLPDRSNPLNITYPGPLEEGPYLLFLKKVEGTDLYSITGLWQGVYPIWEGKTIALRGSGFSEFHGLTLSGVEQKLKRISPR